MPNTFLSSSFISKELLKSAKILKNLNINVLISGASGTGKKTLARNIDKEAKIILAKDFQELLEKGFKNFKAKCIIIDKFEDFNNLDLLELWLKNSKTRIIALAKTNALNKKILEHFCVNLEIPALESRLEDKNILSKKFAKQAKELLGKELFDKTKQTNKAEENTDLENAHLLKQKIYLNYFFEHIKKDELLLLMEKFILKNFSKDFEDFKYKDFLYLYEAPLLKIAKEKYKSQVKMSKHLGLNRTTLRKKLEANKDFL